MLSINVKQASVINIQLTVHEEIFEEATSSIGSEDSGEWYEWEVNGELFYVLYSENDKRGYAGVHVLSSADIMDETFFQNSQDFPADFWNTWNYKERCEYILSTISCLRGKYTQDEIEV